MHHWAKGHRRLWPNPDLFSNPGPDATITPAYFDSCFCSRKRSSSSWMRCTKSFSAEERKTPSKQRRARVTGGRTCGATDTAAIKARPGPTLDQGQGLSSYRRGAGLRGGEGTRPGSPGRAVVGQLGGLPAPAALAFAVPGLARRRLGPAQPARSTLPGPEARGPGGARGLLRASKRGDPPPGPPASLTAGAPRVAAAALRIPRSLRALEPEETPGPRRRRSATMRPGGGMAATTEACC